MNRRKRMIAFLLIIIMAVTALPYHTPAKTVEAAESTYVDTIQDETVLVDNDFSSYPEYDEWLATQIFGEGNYVFGHGGTDATISIEDGKLRIIGDDGGSATDGNTINRTQFLLANHEEISEKGVLIECEYTINEGTTNAFAFASKPIVQGASYIEANDIWYAGVYTNKVRAALRCTDLANAWIPIQDNTGANCYTVGTTYNLMVEVTPTAGVNLYAKAPGDIGYVKKAGLGISKMDTQFANAIATTNADGTLKYPNAANASFAECLEDNVRLIVQCLCDISIDNLKIYLGDQAGVDETEKNYLFNEDFDGEEYSREAYGKWLAEEIFGEGNYSFGQGTQNATMYMENGALRIIGDNYIAPTDGRTQITKSQFLLSDNASISERGAIIEFDYTLNEGSNGYFALASKPLVEGASGIDSNDMWISGIWANGYRTSLTHINDAGSTVWNKPGYATTSSDYSATSTTYKIKIEALPQETIKLSVMKPDATTYTAIHNLTLTKMINNFGTTLEFFDKCFDDNLRLLVASNCDVTIDNLKITKANASEVVYENDFSSSSIASLQDDYLAKAISGDRNFIRTSGTTLAIENGALRVTGGTGSGITQLLISSDDRIAECGAVIECDYTLNEGSANTFAFASKPLASSNIYNQENWISGILASGHFASLMDTGVTKWYTPGRYFDGASYAAYSQTSTTYNLRLEVTPMNYLRLYAKTSDATGYTLLANLTKTQLVKYPDVSFANCLDGNIRLLVYDKCDVTIDNLKISLAPLPKDSNYDEKVDILDIVRMKKALSNDDIVMDTDVSNIDADTTIDNDDVVALREYLTTGVTGFSGGTYVDTYACGKESEQDYYTSADSTQIDTYVDELRNNGYVKQQDNTIGSNRYVTLAGEKGLVHLTYLDYNQSLAVVKEPLTSTVYKGGEPKYTNVTNTSLAVMSLNYDGEGRADSETNANGESFVVALRDGRYVIVDGGYGCDAVALYNYLKDNNKRTDGIKIAAWFLSHAHEDHYGAFAEFANTYNAEVSVEYVVAAEGASSMYSGGYSNWLATKLPSYMKKFGAKQIRPHAGQTLKFCDVKFNILYTGEIYLNNADGDLLASENNASLVFQMVADGKKVLFTNDADKQVSELLVDMYGTNLKSNILQVNHHGRSGAIKEFVQNVNPTYSLWATNQTSYNLRVDPYAFVIGRDENDVADLQSHNGMQYLLTLMGDNNENCFVADGDVEIIQLNNMTIKSYTPVFTTETVE